MSTETQSQAQSEPSAQPTPTNTNVQVIEPPWLTFPPFPDPPPGVTLIPFSEFKPGGLYIKIEDDEGPEMDALGIPTVTLGVKHALTEDEQARKKKKKKTVVKSNGVVKRLMWYEEWEEGEHMRRCIVDQRTSRVDRLHQACQDFRNTSNRPWPPPTTGVLQLWDAFRLYIGIISRIFPPPSKRRQFQQDEPEDDSEDDDEGDGNGKAGAEIEMVNDEQEAKERQIKREQEEIEQRKKNFDDAARARAEKRGELKEQRMEYFFDNPESAMKEFFSAHFRDKGLIWDKARCRDGPILVEFFLNFLIRSNVFPEYDRELRRAVNVVKMAKRELPLTFLLGENLPDTFGTACEYVFGNMTNGLLDWDTVEGGDKTQGTDEIAEKSEDVEMKKEEEAKAQQAFTEFVAANGNPNISAIDPNDPDFNLPQKIEQDAVADNVDINGNEVRPTSGWGDINDWTSGAADSNTGGWGSTGGGGWGDNAWGGPDNSGDNAGDEWIPSHKKSLTDILGPTVMPFTHTTGIMERSTRKIVKVVQAPKKGVPSGKKKISKKSPAELVEEELESRLGYVVLGPWKKIGNDIRSDISPPMILPDSRGYTTLDDPETSPTPKPDVHVHDPDKDEITVLLEPSCIEKFKGTEGMGLLGTWIQIARTDTEAMEEWAGFKKRGKKKGAVGVNGVPTKWWYIEQVMATFVSFHADRYYPDQD